MSKSPTLTKPRRRTHPGEILRREFMAEHGMSINQLDRNLHVPVMRVGDVVNARRAITPDTAARLGRHFGTSPQFRLSLQANYHLSGLDTASIEREIRPVV